MKVKLSVDIHGKDMQNENWYRDVETVRGNCYIRIRSQ